MTRVLEFQARNPKVRAMRIILGTTTKSQIMEFCPTANVGVKMNGDTPDDTDIRWLVAPGGDSLTEDGEWLVHRPGSGYEFLDDTEFHARYEAAE